MTDAYSSRFRGDRWVVFQKLFTIQNFHFMKSTSHCSVSSLRFFQVLPLLVLSIFSSLPVFAQKKAWKTAQKMNTITSYEDFIRQNTASKYAPAASERLCQLLFEEAKKENTPAAFQKYLARCPKQKNSAEAAKRYCGMCFEEASAKNTREAWTDFLLRCPKSEQAPKVKENICQMDFERVKSKPSVAGWGEIITLYPATPQAKFAKTMLDSLNWAEIAGGRNANDIQLVFKFVQSAYLPDGKHVADARRKMRELAARSSDVFTLAEVEQKVNRVMEPFTFSQITTPPEQETRGQRTRYGYEPPRKYTISNGFVSQTQTVGGLSSEIMYDIKSSVVTSAHATVNRGNGSKQRMIYSNKLGSGSAEFSLDDGLTSQVFVQMDNFWVLVKK